MKTIIKIFICISLIYTPFFAFAGAAEKWEIVEKVYDSASKNVELTARKVGATAANDPIYKARVPVAASELGSAARSGIVGLALFSGVSAMLAGIGWIMEDGGRVFKREIPPDPADPSQYQYKWRWDYERPQFDCYSASTCVSAGNARQTYLVSAGINSSSNKITYSQCNASGTNFVCTGKYPSGSARSDTIGRFPNDKYNPSKPKQYEILSDTQLGEEILGEGQNNQPLPDVIADVYDPNSPIPDSAPKQKTADALDSATPQPGTEPTGSTTPKPNTDTDGDGVPDAYDPASPDQGTNFSLPNFCSWAPAVCDFFTVQKADNKDIKNNQREQIEQDKTFFQKVSEWFDWSQTDDELPENESPEIVEHITPDLKEDAISWVSSCPADVSIPISMQGVSSTLVFSWSPWCQLLSIIKPAIIASAYIGAAFIVLGLRT